MRSAPRLSAAARGYGAQWRKAREQHLRAHPLCAFCLALGRVTAATVVDHRTPHRGDPAVFWDRTQWQSLCATCHSAVKQRAEKSGHLAGHGLDGRPLDPAHHWNQIDG